MNQNLNKIVLFIICYNSKDKVSREKAKASNQFPSSEQMDFFQEKLVNGETEENPFRHFPDISPRDGSIFK